MNDELKTAKSRHEYDIPTAVTFLIAGLGVGSILTLLFSAHATYHSSPLADAAQHPSLP